MKEKRTEPRFGPLVLKARLDVGGEIRDGYLTNISAGGAFLAMNSPPSIGTEIVIRAPLPWNLGELRAQARVVWRKDPNAPVTPVTPDTPDTPDTNDTNEISKLTGVGVAFIRLEEGSQAMLDAYLQRFAELAAQLDESSAAHDGH